MTKDHEKEQALYQLKGEKSMYIITGAIAFIFLFLFDIYTLTNAGIKKKIFGVLGLGLFTYSALMVAITSERVYLPMTLRVIGFILWAVTGALLIYSLFLELPFVRTYGKNQHSNELVDTGTYALCRHPGVLWFGLMFLFFFFTTGAKLLIPAGILWTGIDVFHVYLQEKLFFPKMFPRYKDYMREVPMLIPTERSIKKCINTLI
ncbi:MAG: putative rane protein [Clostridia bacterium]|jgi:protein-S-isoprenylcysteine O-methyltransferase Ste14|nr:putative rane protein [Clostridia bacterium]